MRYMDIACEWFELMWNGKLQILSKDMSMIIVIIFSLRRKRFCVQCIQMLVSLVNIVEASM